jgi:hypothetical protein
MKKKGKNGFLRTVNRWVSLDEVLLGILKKVARTRFGAWSQRGSGGAVEAAVTIEVGQAAIAEEKTWFGWRTMKNGMVNALALSQKVGHDTGFERGDGRPDASDDGMVWSRGEWRAQSRGFSGSLVGWPR